VVATGEAKKVLRLLKSFVLVCKGSLTLHHPVLVGDFGYTKRLPTSICAE
jgi:hypothetical protein